MQIPEIPVLPGNYLLCLWLDEAQVLKVGRLGEYFFPQGGYLYAGSAQGPGGLRGRLQRHLLGGSRKYWHIDTLRQVSLLLGFVYKTIYSPEMVERVCSYEPPFISTIDVFKKLVNQLVAENRRVCGDELMDGEIPVECRWSKFLAAVPGIGIPAPGFGASDCRSGCPAHLVWISGDQ